MPYFARNPDACPHRYVVHSVEEPGAPDASCKILQKIGDNIEADSSTQETDATDQSRVPFAVCQQCCRWPEPSVHVLNPVVASLVLDRMVRDKEGDAERQSLRQRAIAAIPIMAEEPDTYAPSNEPPPDVATVKEIEQHLPLPNVHGKKPSVRDDRSGTKRWMVGITTSPRTHATLDDCLASIRLAGWRHVHVFQDGKDDRGSMVERADSATMPGIEEGLDVTRLQRSSNVGAWSNFVLSALELVHRDPDADAYMMLQDDALLTRSSAVRPYLEGLLDSIGPGAAASLFSCQADTSNTPGWKLLNEPVIRGAEGFVFSRDAMWRFVDSPMCRPWQIPWHHGNRRPLEQRGVDGNVGRWAIESGTPLWLPSPSIVWHLGDTSTLWPGAVMLGIRRAGQFLEQVLTDTSVTSRQVQ